ncbi:MAG: sulfate reduction electron transfer complex DsrMKJOP subunit DsrJ [Desulfovibrio sp.]|jgi:hypothetical protein|nr:sulfate reduction electron transfer complex DsrMKJOP subunit DsrJ [Desulfovibrio sp.]
MYNAKYIVPGLVLFLLVFSAPFLLSGGGTRIVQDLAPPLDKSGCVEDRLFMASSHMRLLSFWRDQALREGKREYVSGSGKVFAISLRGTCFSCHADPANFCDKCHLVNGARPYCGDCHQGFGEGRG